MRSEPSSLCGLCAIAAAGIAAPEAVIGEYGLVARLGILDGDGGPLGLDLEHAPCAQRAGRANRGS